MISRVLQLAMIKASSSVLMMLELVLLIAMDGKRERREGIAISREIVVGPALLGTFTLGADSLAPLPTGSSLLWCLSEVQGLLS